ncbi:MAG TPA: DUF4340 domain-containing protein [Bacteroidales bacterium]|nr:DUF4340 domain-containing protein [Bacteroidales bacterium]
MKKNRIAIVLVIILAVITALLFLVKNRMNTLNEKYSDFAVDDTASVTKVFLADKDNNTITLLRTGPSKWSINNEYTASKDAITMLLKTLMSVEVKEPVSKAGREQVVKLLATNSTKVEIYQKVYRISLFDKIKLFPHEKLTKTYYVGCATQNNMGTYMLIEGADTPYITHIFGFRGFLTTRYSPLIKDWRDHTIFNLKYPVVKSVRVQIQDDHGQSFKAVKTSQKNFHITSLDSNKSVMNYDTVKLMELFSSFEDVRFEALLNDMEPLKKDSIVSSPPYIIIDVENTDGNIYNVTTFLRKAAPDEIDQEGKPVIYDRDRLYALINDKKDLTLIQFYVFSDIFKPLDYYLNSKPQNQ